MSDPNYAPKWADTMPARNDEPATDSEMDRWIADWESSAIKTPTGALRLMAGIILGALATIALVLCVRSFM